MGNMFLFMFLSTIPYIFCRSVQGMMGPSNYVVNMYNIDPLAYSAAFAAIISQQIGLGSALFALYFAIEFGSNIKEINPKIKTIGNKFFIVANVASLILIFLAIINIWGIQLVDIPIPTIVGFINLSFCLYSFIVPIIQLNILRKMVLRSRTQIKIILVAYITHIIYFFIISFFAVILMTPELISGIDFEVVGFIELLGLFANLFSLSLFFISIYLPKLKRQLKEKQKNVQSME